MGRTKRLITGVGFGYVNQFLVTLTGLWLTPFLLGRVGTHDYGLWLVGLQVTAYLALIDVGVVMLLPRETALAAGRAAAREGDDGREEVAAVVGQTMRLALWQTPLVAAASVALWFMMPAAWESLRRPLALVLLVFVVAFPLRVFQAALQGLQDFKFLGKTQLCAWAAGTIATVALVVAGAGLYALAAGWAFVQLVTPIVSYLRLRREHRGVLPSRLPRLEGEAAGSRLRHGAWASLSQVAQIFLYGTDVLVIGKLLGPAAVVPYVCTAKLVTVLANQPQMILQAAVPALSELRGGGRREHTARVCAALAQAMLLVSGWGACVVLATNRGFVNWWVGPEQYGGHLLTALVLANMLLRHFNLTVAAFLFSHARDRRLALTALADGAATVATMLLLTRPLGAAGAQLALLAGVCLVSIPLNLRALAGTGAVGVAGLLRSLWSWFWRFALLALAAFAAGRAWSLDSLHALAAVGALFTLAYAALMLPVALGDPLGEYVRPRLASLAARLFRAPQRHGGQAG